MRRRASEKEKVATTWKMNDESDSIRPHFLFSLSLFPLLYPLSFIPRSSAMHEGCVRVCLCGFVHMCAFVLKQVRRRLKSRQPGGRRRSKGFRLVPPTRTASVVAVHPRVGAGQIKRTRADNTGHRVHREARARKAEDEPGRRLRRRCTPRRPYRGKATAWKTTPRQRPRPGLDGRPVDCSERKSGASPAPLFFDTAPRRAQGYEKRPEAGQSTRNSLTQQR